MSGPTSTIARTPDAREGMRPEVNLGRFAAHSWLLTTRAVRSLVRQPAFAAITLVQPVIWLLLFGQLFRSVVRIPGFSAATGSYLEFITPGVIVMTALFSSGWAGTVFIEDMDRGVMDRLLASPVRRGAMIVGTLAYQSLTTVVQSMIVFGIAFASGARFTGGMTGVLVTLLAACLISVVIASFSNTIALLVRQQEALIGISQFIVLPLQFLSSAIMDTSVSPAWVRHVARYNPVDWACTASRSALSSGTDWGVVLPRLGLLVALAVALAWLATRAFRTYQRSI
jgi:ABC-2 type transport system permease protein